ncbi:DMT family transporter [Natronomonas sp. EA1]|uniref:DMT family transporter n=1 Tax=Natronomonas sp. EA1 TaxID=3421655 RepID=UPI003EBA6226
MSRLRAVAPFAVLAVLWGLSFPAITIGLDALPPVLFAAFRYDLAAVLLLGYAVTTDRWRPTTPANLAAVVAGGCFLVAGNAFLFIGQQTVPSGIAAVLQGLVPIATTLWALPLLPNERVSAVGAVGILLGFLGVGLVVQPDPANLLAGDTFGKLLVLAQVASVALGGVLVQRANPSLDQTAMAGWSMLIGAVILHAVSAGLAESFTVPSSPTAVGAVVYLGVFATAIAFFLYFTMLERYGAMETSLVAYVVPLVATVAGILVLDEPIKPLVLVGFAVVFVGFVLLKRQSLRGLLRERLG